MKKSQSTDVLALRAGRTLRVRAGADADEQVVELRSPTGDLELSIEITPEGPRLRIRALDIELNAARALRMTCVRAEIVASETIALVAGSDLNLSAQRGTAKIHANDDVDVRGERILLNSDAQPIASTWEEYETKLKALRGTAGS